MLGLFVLTQYPWFFCTSLLRYCPQYCASNIRSGSGLSSRCKEAKKTCGLCFKRIICKGYEVIVALYDSIMAWVSTLVDKIVAHVKKEALDRLVETYTGQKLMNYVALYAN